MATQEQKIIFRKMEDILYSYNKYINKIKKDLEYFNNPVLLKSYNVEKISGSGFMEVKSDMERIEELKVRISNDISRHEEILFRIDSALDMVKDHKDYSIIDMKYLNNMSYEDISEKLGVSLKTVYGKRNRILGALEIHFKLQRLIEF
ncbi:RNA polymerase sigma factor [Fusobacterium watanabei]|uniref:RNA polymerase sigma factor n=1 Tax=Fusobacterium watanabei TaxID=2686067 RepID=UPI003B589E71